MLTAARALAKNPVPVVGVNRGGLGFLTDISPDELEFQLDEVFAGKYTVEERFLLHTKSDPTSKASSKTVMGKR